MGEIKLIGPRVILRPLKLSDAFDIYSNIDKKIAKQMRGILYPFKLRDARNFIQESKKNWRTKKTLIFGIELKSRKEIIGCISLYDFDQKNEIEHEIAYWLGKKYRGRGLITEALNLVFNFVFKKLKCHRVWADVFNNNFTSQKLLKKLRFKKEGRHREAYWHWGCWRDGVHYGLLAREFLRKKK